MRSGTIAFLLGSLLLQCFAQLPDVRWALLLMLLPAAFLWPSLRWIVFACAGFAWVLLRAHSVLSAQLPPQLEGQDLWVEVVVTSVPQTQPGRVRFQADTWLLDDADRVGLPLGRVLLSWYATSFTVRTGERWHLLVRLKRPRGYMNPGGFDYERWLFQNRIGATGYVRKNPGNRRVAATVGHRLNAFRAVLSERIVTVLADSEYRGVITALAVGVRGGIQSNQWDTLLGTGTNHLIAISGLHIGLVAGLAFGLLRWLWGRSGWALQRWPAAHVGAFGAIAAAVAYAGLAGFSVPTQRALIMVAAAMLTLLLRRPPALSGGLAAALIGVLVYDPLAVLDSGFWLSFGAVGVILMTMTGRLRSEGLWWKWGRLQCVIAVGLFPLVVLFFQRAVLIAPLANLIAVPWMSLIVVPLTLLGVVALPLGDALAGGVLTLAASAIGALWYVLEGLADLPHASWMQAVPAPWTLVPALLGSALLLMPRGLPARWLGLIGLLPMCLGGPAPPAYGELRLSVLDVGQGLSAVVQTAHRTLVFDAGPWFSERFDTGAAVVAPYLRHAGVGSIDMLVVSHGDRDHIGGVASLRGQLRVAAIYTSVPRRLQGERVRPCVRGERWEWDGVTFEFLHPSVTSRRTGNNGSCVLRVANGAGSVLLPGDIEVEAEQELVAMFGQRLASDVVIAPHHGSKTSSSLAFLDAVRPDYVLFPVGHRNRFGFPHSEVVLRYATRNVQLLDTARSGAITLEFPSDGGGVRVRTRREHGRRYWHAR